MGSTTAPAGTLPRILRNAGFLMLAQVIATPVSVLVNAVAARVLGAAAFGSYYQVTTFAAFALVFVEWGQPNVLTARVAAQRGAAGLLLGSALSFRACAGMLALLAVPAIAAGCGCDGSFVLLLALAMAAACLTTLAGAGQDVIRGFERTDFAAASHVGWQLIAAAAIVPTLLAGARVQGMLIAQVICAALSALFVGMMLPRLQVPPLSVRLGTVKDLTRAGRPFIVFSLVLMLQPMVDAAMLSAYSAPAGIGWYSAARKLVGVLVYPAAALIAALYPTLCRLRGEDEAAFRHTTAQALVVVGLMVVPVALGCLLFPELGIAIFGSQGYAPAADDLRLLSLYVFLVYFSMPVSSCLVASGRQTPWTAVQVVCVVISAAADPFLIHWTQVRYGNGGLGVCVSSVISELLMVVAGVWLLPAGVLGAIPGRRIVAAAVAGGAMVVVALAAGRLGISEPWVTAPLAVLAYFLCLSRAGGVSIPDLRAFLGSRIRGR